ncbi:hypothetical protein HCN44_001410 [Aphidius gifuensis]|uniref:Conserved oligomeric Golgi complex subunit 3 n=2 Tax=Aphidius gifuensis TaxID=684658 RepID=A0A834XRD5_APHGI|nr:hypothetical protein HCN44_001410 [Aphidius gifuensis]
MNLINWDRMEDALAPLSDKQKYLIACLEEEVMKTDVENYNSPSSKPTDDSLNQQQHDDDNKQIEKIETCRELLKLYATLETKCESSEYTRYSNYLEQLKTRRDECQSLCKNIEDALDDFAQLSRQYAIVSGKTTSLHSATEQLISEQEKLNDLVNQIGQYTKYFKESNFIMDKLDSPSLSVRSDTFIDITEKIEKNIEFMEKNDKFKEASSYLVKYRHCQSRVINMMHNWIMSLLDEATKSILNQNEDFSELNHQGQTDSSLINTPDTIMALLYGRFQQILPKMRPIVNIIEKRSYKRQEYDSLLADCHQKYLTKRGMVLVPSVQMGLQSAKDKYNGDHCSHVRHACSLLLHASIDEYRLFYQFFDKKTSALTEYLESLCTSLYDSLRPSIINIIHLETLAEICCILRIEMLEEHVHNNMEALEGFGNVCLQLLHDAQERLVYRAHLYLQSDIQGYNPSPGDLAYPDKLKMMEDIAESLREEDRQARIKKISVTSLVPSVIGSSNESLNLKQEQQQQQKHIAFEPLMQKSSVSNSPADLHGMWYPTVRRTLVCLSRLYRCVDRPVFQSLSHDAITFCVESVENAKEKIQQRSTEIDALLFQIKHLLILREQIAPFQVDFTIKEYSLDFSKVKTAAFGLLEKRSRLFALSNNALLEFLLEGAPRMKEHLIDSRKHVDAKLKASCQRLIQHCTDIIVEPINQLLEQSKQNNNNNDEVIKIEAQQVAKVVSESLRLIKFRLPSIQQSMQLYLANKETECILFKPIRNNVVGIFAQLSHFIYANYSTEEQLLIACPLPEQISIMLSSTSLSHGKSIENLKSPTSTQPEEQSSHNNNNSFADIVN